MKVLLIEDDTLMRKMLKKIIAGTFPDAQFTECPNGREGVEVLDSGKKFDFAILDYEMPEMDGSEVIEYIRTVRKDKYFPVLMCTSRHDRKTVLRLLHAGASDYIAKPFEPAKIIEKVNRILTRAKRLQDLRKSAIKRTPPPPLATPAPVVAPVPPPEDPDITVAETPDADLTPELQEPEKQAAANALAASLAEEDEQAEEKSREAEQETPVPAKEKAPKSIRHTNIGDDIIDDSDEEETVFIDITATDDDDDDVAEISEDEFAEMGD